MPFLNQPKSERIGVDPVTGRVWRRLLEPLVHEMYIGGQLIRTEVPSGFEYDGASIPNRATLPDWLCKLLPMRMRWGIPIWALFPPIGKYDRPAILHDFLYSQAGNTPRCLADAIFYEAMLEDGVKWRRPIMFYAVRWFGGGAYHSR